MTSTTPLASRILGWFDANRRDLPWRQSPTPWGVLVSEVMLAQTPVARVEPVWQQWLARWPTPAALAGEPAAAAIAAWGRLGYPRRALRLHQAARVITDDHGGEVPGDYETLRTLPGVGDYTAAAVVAFAFGQRSLVLDVNVRRLYARLYDGLPAQPGHITKAERSRAAELIPATRPAAWAAATMELGQLVCTARNPVCGQCPVASDCRWLARGRPDEHLRTTRVQRYAGTDRQVRGLILERLRRGPATQAEIDVLWNDPAQLSRAMDSLVTDGLVDPVSPGQYSLPGDTRS